MRIKKGDLVEVIAGKDKGKQGTIMKVLRKENRVIVEGINIQTKHIKPNNTNPDGGISKIEGPINASNVMFVDPETKKPTRIGYQINKETGRKERIAKKSQSVIKEG